MQLSGDVSTWKCLFLSFLPSFLPSSLLKTRGSRVSEMQLECEVQIPRPLSGPMMDVYVFLGFYSHSEICLSGHPGRFELFL